MKKLVLILAACAATAIGAKAGGWNYSGYDGNGNWVHGTWDRNGNYSGYDGNGNWVHGHMDRNGNYSGYDGDGNWVHGHWSPN